MAMNRVHELRWNKMGVKGVLMTGALSWRDWLMHHY